MAWYVWLGIIFGASFLVALLAVWLTVKICEERYYGSPILWQEMLGGRRYSILGLTKNRAGDKYAMLQDQRREEIHLVFFPSDLNLTRLKVGDQIKVRRETRLGVGTFLCMYRVLRNKGCSLKKLVRCYSVKEA